MSEDTHDASPPTRSRAVVVLAVPVADPLPVADVTRDRLEDVLIADAVDSVESLTVATVGVLCSPSQLAGVAASAGVGTAVWTGAAPTVREAANHAAAAGAEQVVVIASDAPHLPGLLVGKLFRPLGRVDVTVSPDPRGFAVAIGLRLPVPDWVGEFDLDQPDVVDALLRRAPRRALVRAITGWRRLREPADFAALHAGVDGADLTRALL
ncbi:MAG TPA: hypothetical protein VEX15_19930 [Nocardioidaceae bacterium]|nr:hypothetical protein [Nocardioidaceae bacterium]